MNCLKNMQTASLSGMLRWVDIPRFVVLQPAAMVAGLFFELPSGLNFSWSV